MRTGAPATRHPAATRVKHVRPLLDSLRMAVAGTLGRFVPAGARCALLEFPDYANVGDSAIWLGTRAWLRQSGARVVYAAEMSTYDRAEMAAGLGDGVVLLQGGGNFGDLWPRHQRFRERVIADFPDNRIIQLPQTICFAKQDALLRARGVLDAHPNLVLLARDERSLEVARNEFKSAAVLCPDMAFALDPVRRGRQPTVRVVWLARGDRESLDGVQGTAVGHGVRRTDWLEERPTASSQVARWCLRMLERTPRALRPGCRLNLWAQETLAAGRLRRGRRILSCGSVVITDRLHGHIMCLLLGIPHVLMDTRYGKIRAFYQTWTSASDITHWAESSEEALALAQHLAGELNGEG